MPSRSFKVVFGRRAAFGHVAAGPFKLAGRGTIEIGLHQLRLSGKRRRPFWFGASEQHDIDTGQVVDVGRAGKRITLTVVSRAGRSVLGFAAHDESDAKAILRLLPTRQTEAFAVAQAEQSAFEDRLRQLSPRAPVTPVLLAINVAVFIAMCVAGVGVFKPDGRLAIQWGTNFGPLTLGGQWWRLLSSNFVHFGILHLALNMFVLYSMGRMIERLFGSARFLLLYLLCGLAGSMASLLWNPQVNSAGASGAIFGLFGGLLAFVLDARNGVPPTVMRSYRETAIGFAMINLFYGGLHAGIDNAAHVGGLLGGLVIGFALARPLQADARPGWLGGRSALAVGVAVLSFALAGFRLVHPPVDVQQRLHFQQVMTAIGSQEQAAIDATLALNRRLKAGLTDAQFAHALARDVLPKWDVPYDALRSAPLPPGDEHAAMRQQALRYFTDRRKQFLYLQQSIERDDPALLKQSNAMKADADAANEAMGKLVDARRGS